MTPQHPLNDCQLGSVSKANAKDLTGKANAASTWVIGETTRLDESQLDASSGLSLVFQELH